jgi:hypothetical protein
MPKRVLINLPYFCPCHMYSLPCIISPVVTLPLSAERRSATCHYPDRYSEIVISPITVMPTTKHAEVSDLVREKPRIREPG